MTNKWDEDISLFTIDMVIRDSSGQQVFDKLGVPNNPDQLTTQIELSPEQTVSKFLAVDCEDNQSPYTLEVKTAVSKITIEEIFASVGEDVEIDPILVEFEVE